MSAYDITQLVISILSLVATVAISIILYILDRKRDKEIEEQNEIYNNFNLCPDEVKEIILNKQKISLKNIDYDDWFEKCNDRFQQAIRKFDLGRNMYYDNAKYVRYCFEYYGKENISFDTSFNVKVVDYDIKDNTMVPWRVYSVPFYSYVNHYFHFFENVQKYKNPDEITTPSPCDVVYSTFVNADEKVYCYWCAEQMRCICSFLREWHYENSLYRNSYSQAIEIHPEFFEDIYYCALYELYITFGKEFG
jgi:hypothetical protein